eukprot:6338002-Prymnesium_polylepis.1
MEPSTFRTTLLRLGSKWLRAVDAASRSAVRRTCRGSSPSACLHWPRPAISGLRLHGRPSGRREWRRLLRRPIPPSTTASSSIGPIRRPRRPACASPRPTLLRRLLASQRGTVGRRRSPQP